MPLGSDNRFLAPRFWTTWLLLGCMRLGAFLPLPLLVLIGGLVGEILYLLAFDRRRVATINLRNEAPTITCPIPCADLLPGRRSSTRCPTGCSPIPTPATC